MNSDESPAGGDGSAPCGRCTIAGRVEGESETRSLRNFGWMLGPDLSPLSSTKNSWSEESAFSAGWAPLGAAGVDEEAIGFTLGGDLCEFSVGDLSEELSAAASRTGVSAP